MEIKEGHDYVLPYESEGVVELFRVIETKVRQDDNGVWYSNAEGFTLQNGEAKENKPSVYQINEQELAEKGREATEQERSLLMDSAP